jgi:hypothetical protein
MARTEQYKIASLFSHSDVCSPTRLPMTDNGQTPTNELLGYGERRSAEGVIARMDAAVRAFFSDGQSGKDALEAATRAFALDVCADGMTRGGAISRVQALIRAGAPTSDPDKLQPILEDAEKWCSESCDEIHTRRRRQS